MKSALILLTFNEIQGLKVLWEKLPLSDVDEIFTVDPGSTDGTLEFLRERHCRVVIQERRGRGEAFRLGAEATDADILVFFSPDGNEDPKDIIKLINLIKNGADIAIGSRMMKGAVNEEDISWWRPRKWVNEGFTFIANLLFNPDWPGRGKYFTDTINGFRAFKRTSFLNLHTTETGYPIEYQTSIRSLKKRYRIEEIPTIENQRIGGESYSKSIPTGLSFVKCLFKEICTWKI